MGISAKIILDILNGIVYQNFILLFEEGSAHSNIKSKKKKKKRKKWHLENN